jgi:hypothetical protein
MTDTEYLLECLSEEAAEVIQRVSKAKRFGPRDVEPGQTKEAEERLYDECVDFIAVFEMVKNRLQWPKIAPHAIIAKQHKVLQTMDWSRERGLLSTLQVVPTSGASQARSRSSSDCNEPMREP